MSSLRRLLLLVVCAASAYGQAAEHPGAVSQEPAQTPSAPPPSEEETPEAEPSVKVPEKPVGDTITLKSGGVLRGFQVLRATPRYYEVEIVSGSVALRLPRRQVESIVYDDFDPLRSMGERPGPAQGPSPVPPTPTEELDRKLDTDISEPPARFDGQDFLAILEEVGRRAGIELQIEESVRNSSAPERTWSYALESASTARDVLRALSEQFPGILVTFDRDTVVISARPAEPPAAPLPPASPEEGQGG